MAPPLPLDTPLLLVKPPVGLSTPEIFKALDLDRRSTADPLDLLARLASEGATQVKREAMQLRNRLWKPPWQLGPPNKPLCCKPCSGCMCGRCEEVWRPLADRLRTPRQKAAPAWFCLVLTSAGADGE